MTDWADIARETVGKNDPIKLPQFGLRHALVASVDSTTTCTITLAGVNISGVKWVIQRPVAGATVLVYQNGTDFIVAGMLSSGSAWDTYTPVLTASSVNPTLGTSSIQNGRFTQIGKTVHCRGRINVGLAGFATGTGTYRISLPINTISNTAGYAYGTGSYFRNATSGIFGVFCEMDPGTASNAYFYMRFADYSLFSSGGTIAQNDEVWWDLTYEAA